LPVPAVSGRSLRRLVKELAEAASDVPDLGFRLEVSGTFDVDTKGEISISVDLPDALTSRFGADVSAEFGRSSEREVSGAWKLEVWRDPAPREATSTEKGA
jgi:hypothetical protein